ncbi:hypothetical protein N9164_06045 [Draconibacterium sp.]|nr:hypothetical protein [Draconibacterium sp.]
MMNKYFLIIVLALATYVAKGQDQTLILVNYSPAISLGETADFTNNFSPRGVDFEVNRFIKEDLSVGFVIGWNVFREKISGETFEYNDLTITGTQFRYTNVTPLNVNVKKYFSIAEDSGISPYAGFGLGTNYAKQTNEIGVFSLTQDKWQFNMAPEIGMLYDISRNNVLSLKVKYIYSPKAGDFPSTSYLSFGIGIGLN